MLSEKLPSESWKLWALLVSGILIYLPHHQPFNFSGPWEATGKKATRKMSGKFWRKLGLANVFHVYFSYLYSALRKYKIYDFTSCEYMQPVEGSLRSAIFVWPNKSYKWTLRHFTVKYQHIKRDSLVSKMRKKQGKKKKGHGRDRDEEKAHWQE